MINCGTALTPPIQISLVPANGRPDGKLLPAQDYERTCACHKKLIASYKGIDVLAHAIIHRCSCGWVRKSKMNCSAHESYSCYNLFLAELTKSASYVFSLLYRFPFRSCSAVQDEGLACGRGADSSAGLSDHTSSINL